MKSNSNWILTEPDRGQNIKLFDFSFSFLKSKTVIRFLVFFIFLIPGYCSFSQNTDSTKVISNFSGAVTITNNGISLIPTFTLDKPAVTFDMAMGRKLSFEPEFQFSLEGKPWGFFFWWRYKLVNNDKFFVRIGTHPALSFFTLSDSTNRESKETIAVQRYLAGEICPNYFLTKHISIGAYYLYSYSLDNEFVRNTNLLMINMNFTKIKLSDKLIISFMPQVYYLRINENDGINLTSSLRLSAKNFPLSLTAFINKTLKTAIPGSKDFVWNVSLTYAFSNKYAKV